MEPAETALSEYVTAPARAMLATSSKMGDTKYDVALQMALDHLEETTGGPGGVESARLLLQLAAEGYDVGAVDEAASVLDYHAAQVATIVNIARSLVSAISHLGVCAALPMADVSSEAAGMQRLAPPAADPWYAREYDADFQVVPIPPAASPHRTNAPPPWAIVLHSADVATGWAA